MLKFIFLMLFLIPVCVIAGRAQGLGGGVWLEDGASCTGTVIYNNLAREGFGVAGKNGILLNCSVSGNKGIVDKSSFPKPGDVFCANGDIVDRVTYEKRATKDAIGVVFWINGDTDTPYPLGAVIALEQSPQKLSWGDWSFSICAPKVDEDIKPSIFLKDTSSYQNTAALEKQWQSNKNFEAGHFCWNYKAYYQKNNPQAATEKIRWCLPVLQHLRRLAMMREEVKKTLLLLETANPEIGVIKFDESDENVSNYWSSDDGNSIATVGDAFYVNFQTGCMKSCSKLEKNWTRPIFLY